MIVADTSALISLATVDLLDTLLTEYDVQTTKTVVEELENKSGYDYPHREASETVLNHLDRITIHQIQGEFESSRIDKGEGSCADLARNLNADFLITDDLRALPELQTLSNTQVAISPILLKALVKKNILTQKEALEKLEEAAENRDWLESPIYRKARELFK